MPVKLPQKLPGQMPVKTAPSAKPTPKATSPNQDRVSMVCASCSYKFSRDGGSRLNSFCPYCGTKNVYLYKPLNADYLLKTTKTADD